MLRALFKPEPLKPLGRWILVTKTGTMDINKFIRENKQRRHNLKNQQAIDHTPDEEFEYMMPFVVDS